MFDAKNFRQYRTALGFNDQTRARDFFGAKDIKAGVDLEYLDSLNNRLADIAAKIHSIIWPQARVGDLSVFQKEYIGNAYKIIKASDILPKLNNQGRRPEEVYFSWMRGFAIANYFSSALSYIFDSDLSSIKTIGDDNLKKVGTFKRTPTADLEIASSNGLIRLEVQSGFTGINDIKQHKVLEAKRIFSASQTPTVAMHADIFNGQVAFIRLDNIKDTSTNWITRQQMEGQTVFNIDQNHFCWLLQNQPPKFKELGLI